jgi:dihydrofolate reductase
VPKATACFDEAMGKVIYAAIASLDGYVEDRHGRFEWAAPDEEVHRFVNEMERSVGTYLYGRRMYDTMRFWETAHTIPDQPAYAREYTEIWLAANKVVFSRTLDSVSTANTRLEARFEADAIRQLKAASDRDLSIGGAELAAQALEAGLVDELHLFVVPVVVGGGKRWLPDPGPRSLTLIDTRRFASGVVLLRYRLNAEA